MRRFLPLLSVVLLGACSLISPYAITFTNTPGSVIDPSSSTLDFVVSAPTLAYISGVSCEGAEALDILPLADKGAEAATVHKLSLSLMKDQPAGAKCEVTVTAYDRTTTDQASASIDLTMNGIPLAKEGEMCGGIAAFRCEEGLTCEIADPTIADASGTCVKPSEEVTPPEEEAAVEETAAPVEETPVVEEPVVETTTEVEAAETVETPVVEETAPVETTEDTTTPAQ
jgi:hypothetical protein